MAQITIKQVCATVSKKVVILPIPELETQKPELNSVERDTVGL